MMTLRLGAAALIAAAAAMLSTAPAQAYPDAPNVSITIPDSVLYGGTTFDYRATADVECDWTVTYAEAVNGPATQTGSGTTISGTYDTKVVKDTFKSPVSATCTYDDGVPPVSAKIVTSNEVTPAFWTGEDGDVVTAATQRATASATVTLLPRSTSSDTAKDNGVLPDTGGSSLWILVVGVGLLLVGAGLTVATRRRRSAR